MSAPPELGFTPIYLCHKTLTILSFVAEAGWMRPSTRYLLRVCVCAVGVGLVGHLSASRNTASPQRSSLTNAAANNDISANDD